MIRVYRGAFFLASVLLAELAAAQPQPVERVLVDSKDYVDVSGPHTRCGDYFVLETKKFGEFEVAEVHVAFELGEAVATSILYSRDIAVAVDESKSTPVLLMKRENRDLEKDTVKLSRAAYEEAKDCLPAPDGGESS